MRYLKNMTLKEILEFDFDLELLSMVDIELSGIVKCVVVGHNRAEAEEFIRHLFQDDLAITEFFKDTEKTELLSFDFASQDENQKYILVCELYPLEDVDTTNRFLKEALEEAIEVEELKADVIFDFYDLNANKYRTSRYDNVVKTDLIKAK